MSWNVRDSFLEELETQLTKCGEAAGEHANLYYNHFLATPLLPVTNKLNKEMKFCGNDDVANHKVGIGLTVDSFIHAALIDSRGEYLFADLQGNFQKNLYG